MTDKTRRTPLLLLTALALAGLTVAAYWPLFHNDFIHYDDADYVTENSHVLAGFNWELIKWAFTTGHASNWHPLTWLSHGLDVQWFGLNPRGHHLTSLALHVANTLLLWLVLARLTKKVWRGAVVAALFALHPLHVESVAWVAERKDVLSGFFFMLTLLAYAGYARARPDRPAGQPAAPQKRTAKAAPGPKLKTGSQPAADARPEPAARAGSALPLYLLALGLFALGLMSKPMLVTLPCLLLLIDWWPLERLQFRSAPGRPGNLWPLCLEKIPFLVVSALCSLITMKVQTSATTPWTDYGLYERFANAVASYLKYLAKTVWPAHLGIAYPHPWVDRGAHWTGVGTGVACLALLAISAVALWRGGRERWLATGWFWFLGTLVPVIGIIQVGSQAMADRYTYLPLIGIFIVATWAVADRVVGGSKLRWGLAGGGIGALVVGSVFLTRVQAGYWHDDFSLFSHALTLNPRNSVAHGSLAMWQGNRGEYQKAMDHCNEGLRADPSDSVCWYVKGSLEVRMGKPREAMESLRRALRFQPNAAQVWVQLGQAYAAIEDVGGAVESYRTALRWKPDSVPAHDNLGAALLFQGLREDALREFTASAQLSPKVPEKHYNLGTTLADGGRLQAAETQLAEAVRLRPGYYEALTALAGVLASEGRKAEAQDRLREADQACPKTPEGRFRLGNALLTSGFTNESGSAFAQAIELEPRLGKALLDSAKSLIAEGQLGGAMARLRAVVRLEPANAEGHERLGLLLASSGSLEEAAGRLREAARLAPTAENYYHLGLVLGMQGKLDEALIDLNKVIAASPNFTPALNDAAWILATAPRPELRDGAQAVLLAERAVRAGGAGNPRLLATLAAAYAEAGRFDEAVSAGEKARETATNGGEKALADTAASRLELYRKHQPFRQ